jgi:phytoene desaturase
VKKITVIGAGIGGIAAAGALARKGYSVTIFEKNAHFGGRCGTYVKEGHRFDVGATFLMMPGIYQEAFSAVGKNMTDELTLYRMDPVYRVKFSNDREIRYTSDLALLQSQFESFETGSFGRFLTLMGRGFNIYEKSMRLIDRNYFRVLDPTLLKYPFLLLRYKAFHNHYRYVSRYFKSEELRAFFTFQNLYLGQNPFTASGMYTFLPFMELADGVFFPKGGMHMVAEKLLSAATEHGVELVLNAPVARIEVNGRNAKGVTLQDGTFHPSDMIISNADLPYVYNHLLPESRMAGRLNRSKYSCSAIVFHWAVDRVYPQLQQHNVFVSEKHKESCEAIFRKNSFADSPSIYVHSPVRSDLTAAPENQDSVTAIVHTGNFDEHHDYDWDAIREQARNTILQRFRAEGMVDFEQHIKFEICFTPDMWKSVFNLTKGGTFGSLAHHLTQMGFLRPGNHHHRYGNLYFAGGSTQPGSGMPLSLLSAKLVTERIERTNRNS